MRAVVDTSVLVSVVGNEPSKRALIRATQGTDLLAPASVHWEIGNAFATMVKRGRICVEQGLKALAAYAEIPIRFVDVELFDALELADHLDIYAYDAYILACALRQRCGILTLDVGLQRAAKNLNIPLVEV